MPSNVCTPHASRTVLLAAALLLVGLLANPLTLYAQAFDPAKVDWEKLSKIPMRDLFIKQFNKNCAACHGEDLRGLTLGPALVGAELKNGDTVKEIAKSIAQGEPGTEMPAWSETLKETEIWNLALYIAEQRQGTTILDKRDGIEVQLPANTVASEKHSFDLQLIAEGLDAMPFAIEPLPDGRLLLSERMRGLRIVDLDGSLSDYIAGTPKVYDDSGTFLGQVQGLGWMLDVALDPDYADNGWIYIHHTDRCTGCNDLSSKSGAPVSMNRIVRGRISDGQWTDQEVLWEADKKHYTNTSDLAAAGRLAFDNEGLLYFSVGIKDVLDVMGTQDLAKPYGKIHRIRTDGSIPADNPYAKHPDAVKSIYTLGHRSAQGLALNPVTGDIWESEMGPRGGDELNRLVKGGNYGWPLYTTGVNYDGRPVKAPKHLSLDESDAEFPVVDWTPAIAMSNFLFYDAEEFPQWQGNIIAGTLRATDLLRLEIEGNKVIHTEVLLEDLVRFRDVALGTNGELYLLLENKAGSMIARLKLAD